MATGAIPFFRKFRRVERRRVQRDPASHGIDFAMELQIGESTGEFVQARRGGGRPGRLARAFSWLHALRFVGSRG